MKATDLLKQKADEKAIALGRDLAAAKSEIKRLIALNERLKTKREVTAKRIAMPAQKGKATRHFARVIVPDSHGNHIDPIARDAFLRDLKSLGSAVEEIVFLGDHVDCGGTFSAHQRSYTNELTESYEDDLSAAAGFLDAVDRISPASQKHYLEGNHEAHVERWVARNLESYKDARVLAEIYGPAARLELSRRGYRYYRSKEFYHGLAVRGSIRLGKCYFTHGISHSKHADASHLAAFSGNVVFGHVHRVLETRSRTVQSQGHGAWCPGTLAKLQPLYKHTEPTSWLHGYGLQFVSASSGRFAHWNVPIFADGTSGLAEAVGVFRR